MGFQHLPFDAGLGQYESQAEDLLAAIKAGDSMAIKLFHERLPRFLDENIPWLPKDMSDEEIKSVPLELADAELAVARSYNFADWRNLKEFVAAVTVIDSATHRFEAAVEAVIDGDADALRSMLRENPGLVRARSTRVSHSDPPVHEATLLHYVAANGVEGYRQRSPKNAVEIARILLDAGAEADALANMYGGKCTTMNMLVSSCHPANAGV